MRSVRDMLTSWMNISNLGNIAQKRTFENKRVALFWIHGTPTNCFSQNCFHSRRVSTSLFKRSSFLLIEICSIGFPVRVVIGPFLFDSRFIILTLFPKVRLFEVQHLLPSQRKYTWRCGFEIFLGLFVAITLISVFRIFITKGTAGLTALFERLGLWFIWLGYPALLFLHPRGTSTRWIFKASRSAPSAAKAFETFFWALARGAWLKWQEGYGPTTGFTRFFAKRGHELTHAI